jgi:hypothetical protein
MMGVIWLAEMLRLPAPQHQLSSARSRGRAAIMDHSWTWTSFIAHFALRADLEVCASRKRFVLLAQIPLSLSILAICAHGKITQLRALCAVEKLLKATLSVSKIDVGFALRDLFEEQLIF